MKENNEISQIDEEIDENCLKDPSFIRPLVIKKKSQRVIFDLDKFKINYIKEALIDENSIEEVALMVFVLLFLLKDKLNCD